MKRERDSTDRLAWTIAIVVFVLFTFTRCGPLWRHPLRLSPFAKKIESPGVHWPVGESAPADDSATVEAPPAEAAPAPADSPSATDGEIRIPDASAAEMRSQASRSTDTEASLRTLLDQGNLRRLSASEVKALQGMNRGAQRLMVIPDGFAPHAGGELQYRAFMVQRAMQLPAGLTGAHMATFVVPQGVPRPTGDPGHSQIIDLNQ